MEDGKVGADVWLWGRHTITSILNTAVVTQDEFPPTKKRGEKKVILYFARCTGHLKALLQRIATNTRQQFDVPEPLEASKCIELTWGKAIKVCC